MGLADVPPSHRRELDQANLLVERTATLLRAARDTGAEYILEHPADRGHISSPLYLHKRHGPLWAVPIIADLRARHSCTYITFPQCALGAPVQKYTTFMCTPGLQFALERLASLTCTHRTHDDNVGGSLDGDNWRSASHSAYPPDLNMIIANAVASRISLTTAKQRTQASPPIPAARASLPATTPSHARSSSVEGAAGATDDVQPAQTSDTHSESDTELNQHFQRGLGAYPLRSRTP
eukprot:1016077-Pleurochrysis_carterae.AAC.1